MHISDRLRVAGISLLLTWLFFCEFIPPAKRVHIWSDIEGYHYPLLSHTHKSLRLGQFPLWDPWIYCGIPFAGNIQAGLFYPPNWLLFAANWHIPDHLRNPAGVDPGPTLPVGMRYTSVEILAFLHVWLAFLFTYLWLRERSAHWLPPALGGAVAALGGYLLSQMSHLGVGCGYTWMPFALWGIDQANHTRSWRPLWKVAIGSAFCLFAGYPPTWLALCIIVCLYAATLSRRRTLLPQTVLALAVSAGVGAVQLLPSIEATRLKTPDLAYGGELPFGQGIWASFFLPNYFDQNRTGEGPEVSDGDYLYLGVPALFALAWLVRKRWFPGAGPALVLTGVVLFLAVDPTGLILRIVLHLPVVPDVLRRYNLLAGLALAAALLACSAVSNFLRGSSEPRPSWSVRPGALWLWVVLVAAWVTSLLYLWPPGAPDFLTGPASGKYAAATLVLFTAGLWLYRARRTNAIAFLLLALVFAEYKAFGTNRRFNAVDENVDRFWRADARLGGPFINGLDREPYHEMLRHPEYRLAIAAGPHSTDMRHYRIPTLQGFDPFLPDQYKAEVERFTKFTTNRLFDIDPVDEKMLRHFGVRWVICVSNTPAHASLKSHPAFRALPPARSYYVVFEYLHAQPAWRFSGDVRMTRWDPEHRSFDVQSGSGGEFVLLEQFFPGWQVRIDGRTETPHRAGGTFQGTAVPAGRHTVEFVYRPASVRIGALITLLSLCGVVLATVRRRHILGMR